MKTKVSLTVLALVMALFSTNVQASDKNTKDVTVEASQEMNLKIEDWMVTGEAWKTNRTFDCSIDNEADLQMETWMTDARNWNVSDEYLNSSDTDLQVETWMTDAMVWNVNTLKSIEPETESKLSLEDWMIK